MIRIEKYRLGTRMLGPRLMSRKSLPTTEPRHFTTHQVPVPSYPRSWPLLLLRGFGGVQGGKWERRETRKAR